MVCLLFAASVFGQSPRTFHVYVNPIQGDNALAAQLNPSGGVTKPLQYHPSVPLQIQGELQHASYSFRTVTAAVNWLATFLPLPYQNQDNGEVVGWVVIHCLPGLYGPRDPDIPSGQEEYDPRSGLPWNGETFPINLPDRVSIQGTSALDTIFDARGYDEPFAATGGQTVFLFASGTGNWSDTFIDGITMRGCRAGAGFPAGAAVAFDQTCYALPTISNCFIYSNDIGIALRDREDPPNHAPRIVNNTIAWNQIGIWSRGGASVQSPGTALPLVLDNLIDPIRPVNQNAPAYFQGVGAGTTETPSCFEGRDTADMTATVVGGGCNVTQNFNAYDSTLANRGAASTWPFGATRPRTATPPAPVVDLNPWNGSWNGGAPIRGDLYVRDVFATAAMVCAPHDFRLAPMTRDAGTTNFVLNRLVNRGITSAQGTITFGNGGQIVSPPGIPNDDLASFHAWDWDCEGFGNPRAAARRIGQTAHFPTVWCGSSIDLGADEMGELIVSGYVDSTRIFSRAHPNVAANTSLLNACEYLYFLNVFATGGGGTPLNYITPQFNVRGDFAALLAPSGRPEWYAQLGPAANPFLAVFDPPLPFAFTGGADQDPALVPASTRLVLTTSFLNPTGVPFPRFMRTRICDIGPHLADDIFPGTLSSTRDVDYAEYAFVALNASTPPRRDIFQASPWYSMTTIGNTPQWNDNKHLYVDGASQRLRHGTLSPPLTVAGDPIQTTPPNFYPSSYLFRDPGRHDINYWGAPTYTYSVGTNGLSLGHWVPYVLGVEWYGYRMNHELYSPDNPGWSGLGSPANNLQTMLVVQGTDATAGAGFAPPQFSPFATTSALESQRRAVEAALTDQVLRSRR